MAKLAHTCHAIGCKSRCPPEHLMCRACWAKVPRNLQLKVYRTVKLRDLSAVDASWAPWWRAQAQAIFHVAQLKAPDDSRNEKWLQREQAFADELEKD